MRSLFVLSTMPVGGLFRGNPPIDRSALRELRPNDFRRVSVIGLLRGMFRRSSVFLGPLHASGGRRFISILITSSRCLLLVRTGSDPGARGSLSQALGEGVSAISGTLSGTVSRAEKTVGCLEHNRGLRFRFNRSVFRVRARSGIVQGLVIIRRAFIGR